MRASARGLLARLNKGSVLRMAENHAAWGVREIAIAAHQSDIPRGDRYPWRRPLHLSYTTHVCSAVFSGYASSECAQHEPVADAVPRLFFFLTFLCCRVRAEPPSEVDLEPSGTDVLPVFCRSFHFCFGAVDSAESQN